MKITHRGNVFQAMALAGAFLGLSLANPALRAQAPPIVIPPPPTLQNGNFETGDLSGWATFVTTNGSIGGAWGLPDVVPFDTTGSGTPSDAAQFQVGQVTHFVGDFEGGGISQGFNGPARLYTFSADIAAQNPWSTPNVDAGMFSLRIDGNTISSVDLGTIGPGQILRGTLTGSMFLGFGPHDLDIEITRPWLNGSASVSPNVPTPFEYLDNIQIDPIPEPSTFTLGLLGLLPLWAARKARNR